MTKQVQLSDDAYARLAANKQPGESFSDVVLRLTPRPSLAKLAKTGRTKKENQAHRRMLHKVDKLDLEDARRGAREKRR